MVNLTMWYDRWTSMLVRRVRRTLQPAKINFG